MTILRSGLRVLAAALAGAVFVTGGSARADTKDFLDLSAGLGFDTNPNTGTGAKSSLFGRLSASGTHQWTSERGSTVLNGYVENTSYFQGGYGSLQIFSLGANTTQAITDKLSLYGNLNFSGDFGGQLSNRLIPGPTTPVPVDPNNPIPPTGYYPDLFGISGQQYQAGGSLGASIRTGARGTISLTAGAQRHWYTGGNEGADYNDYSASAGYSLQFSERTRAGATLAVQHQDFTEGGSANIINPQLTASSQLSERLNASGSIGLLVFEQKTASGTEHSLTPSFSGSLCSVGPVSSLCARVARDAQSNLNSGLINGQRESVVSTIIGVDYTHRLGPAGTIRASLSGISDETPAPVNGQKFRSSYLSAVVGYDRRVSGRIYAGVEGGARQLYQSGPDPKLDLNASVYLRYRLGDLL